ncbi:MAG: hypothetical protein C4532_08810 [Candidatus Abyssobacteria bacterium SURF_17]|uniref:Glycosyltransferase RgtA/B/C/D-like domain-containing protein n=1 Tax=Candidatus Abyssobacteria bacterium SURF_17 TaxID=2093361 RepID=A0A419EZH6_9BACT|nr:MAG: hypothetical protein C4532_08810 [Candidatus Abyssubacteria bacterium SURF_17]
MQEFRQRLPLGFILSFSTIRTWLLVLLCAVLASKGAVFFFRAARVVSYPFEWSTMDGYFVYHGLRLLKGQPIYFGYESLLTPFEYVPLYPLAIGFLARLFGPGVWYERVFGLVCAGVAALLIFQAVFSGTRSRIASLCAALMFFAPASLSVWFLVRGIDIFSACLALGAVLLANSDSRGFRCRSVWAVALFVVAFYAKQTTIFPAAGALAFVMYHNPRRGVAMAVGYAISVALILAVLQYLSNGWFFENAFLTTAMNPYLPRELFRLFAAFTGVLFFAFPAALVQALVDIRRGPTIWTFYFVATAISALLAGKVGAALSYFIPLFTAVCIYTGLWLGNAELFKVRGRTYMALLFLLVLQSCFFLRELLPTPTQEDYLEARALDSHIKVNPGPVLLERIDSFATRNGRSLNVEAVQLPILVMRRKFDPELLIGPIQDREFSVIVYSGVHFGGMPALKQALFENYHVTDRIDLGLFFGRMTFLVLSPRYPS